MLSAIGGSYKPFQNPTLYKIVILSEVKNLVFLNT